MKIKLIGGYASPEGNFQPGHIMDLPDDQAQYLVSQRMAEVVECKALPAIPTIEQTEPVLETTTVRKIISTSDIKKGRIRR
jgi:hypothetical protein